MPPSRPSDSARATPAEVAAPAVVTAPGYLLYKAGVVGQKTFDHALGEVGVSAREFLALSFVSTSEMSQQDLSRRLDLDPTIVVGLIDELETRDIVRRRRDPADRRRYLLDVTDRGRELLDDATVAVDHAEATFLDPLAPSEREQLTDLLVRLMTPKLPWLRDARQDGGQET